MAAIKVAARAAISSEVQSHQGKDLLLTHIDDGRIQLPVGYQTECLSFLLAIRQWLSSVPCSVAFSNMAAYLIKPVRKSQWRESANKMEVTI